MDKNYVLKGKIEEKYRKIKILVPMTDHVKIFIPGGLKLWG